METHICSGPVIIENGKVLLVKEKKSWGITPWLFPGGKTEPEDIDIEATCRREAKEEVGIEIEIVKKLSTLEAPSWQGLDKKYTLHHYLAKRIGNITSGEDIVEWAWLDIDNLPDDCDVNVYKIIEEYKNML